MSQLLSSYSHSLYNCITSDFVLVSSHTSASFFHSLLYQWQLLFHCLTSPKIPIRHFNPIKGLVCVLMLQLQQEALKGVCSNVRHCEKIPRNAVLRVCNVQKTRSHIQLWNKKDSTRCFETKASQRFLSRLPFCDFWKKNGGFLRHFRMKPKNSLQKWPRCNWAQLAG